MPDYTEIKNKISSILRSSMHVDLHDEDVDLVDWGLIDSASFMELFVLLEEEFEIIIETQDLILENFRTIEKITQFVQKKQG